VLHTHVAIHGVLCCSAEGEPGAGRRTPVDKGVGFWRTRVLQVKAR
jgi:hypothetical protein